MIIELEKILIKAASKQLNFDELDGIYPGHNGPYFDKETSVRNTSHWLIIFCCLYARTGEEKYRGAASKAIKFLSSQIARPMSASFHCRLKKEKDFCNGLMGQAWVIEALLYAYDILGDETLYLLAEDVFLMHDFDYDRAIWYRLGVDGSRLPFDNTFNHQLWFAAVGSLLSKTPKALSMCDRFFEQVACKPTLYSCGVLFHNSPITSFQVEKTKGFKSILDFCVSSMSNAKQRKSLFLKSAGYHGFNLYAYELLKQRYREHSFYKSKIYDRMLRVVLTENFKDALLKSNYSYAYNPPAFENGFALLSNGFDSEIVNEMLVDHFKITKGPDGFNNRVSQDVHTSEARLYELVRILEIENLKLIIDENQ
ncbi:hypothetical protein [Thalassotalea maritima]|uniref:hypothetical protein n=1 Tax=Thalassotalea maritima TaxID=3242416 RepID=UPI003529283F